MSLLTTYDNGEPQEGWVCPARDLTYPREWHDPNEELPEHLVLGEN